MFSAITRKFFAKAKKFSPTAGKIPAKFDVFCSRRSVLHSALDVNSFLQVKDDDMHDRSAPGSDLQNRDHVRLFEKLDSFRSKLLSIRQVLPNLVDDHVKLRPDHVKLCLELSCSGAIRVKVIAVASFNRQLCRQPTS